MSNILSISQTGPIALPSIGQLLTNEQEVAYHIQAMLGESITIVFEPQNSTRVLLKEGYNWKELKQEDIPRALQKGLSQEAKAILSTAIFSVSSFSNGDGKLTFNIPLRGGMPRVGDLHLNDLRGDAQFSELVSALERSIGNYNVALWPPSQEKAIVATSTLAGIAVGAGAGAVVGTFIFPVIGTGVGAAVGAVVGGLLAFLSSFIPVHYQSKESQKIVADLETLGNTFSETVRLANARQRQEANQRAIELVELLKRRGYVSRYTEEVLEFNEKQFSSIRKYLGAGQGVDTIIYGMKLLICSILYQVPAGERPTPHIIDHLRRLSDEGIDRPLVNGRNYLLGLMYVDRPNYVKAIEHFRSITNDSPQLFARMPGYIAQAEAIERRRLQLLAQRDQEAVDA